MEPSRAAPEICQERRKICYGVPHKLSDGSRNSVHSLKRALILIVSGCLGWGEKIFSTISLSPKLRYGLRGDRSNGLRLSQW